MRSAMATNGSRDETWKYARHYTRNRFIVIISFGMTSRDPFVRRFPRKKALKNLIAFDSVRSRENNSSQYSSLFAMVKLGNRNRCIFEQREYRMEFHQCLWKIFLILNLVLENWLQFKFVSTRSITINRILGTFQENTRTLFRTSFF